MSYTIYGVLMLLLVVLCCQNPEPQLLPTPLPKPTGSSAVGTEQRIFTRRAEQDSIADRLLRVQIWYPAQSSAKVSFEPYLPDTGLLRSMIKDRYLNLDTEVIQAWDTVTTYAGAGAPVDQSAGPFPLILLSHGFGMSKHNYTALAVEMVSNGYIVAAIDHTGSGLTLLPDGRVVGLVPHPDGPAGKVEEFCEDASFVRSELMRTSQFKDWIDPEAIGMLGHSLGGAAALNIAGFDPRFKAAVNLDGYLFGAARDRGVGLPFLAILQQPLYNGQGVSDSMKNERQLEWRMIVQRSEVESAVVKVGGLMHFDFSDLPFLVPDSIRIKNGGVLPAPGGHQIISALVRSFFDQHLKKKNSGQLQNTIQHFREVSYELPD